MTRRYTTLRTVAARIDDEPDAENYLARTVFEAERVPRDTGLLDWTGTKLFAVDEMDRIGFIRHLE